MNQRFQDILIQILSRFGIKNSRKAFAFFMLTLSVIFLQFAELPKIIDWLQYFSNKASYDQPQSLAFKSIIWTSLGLITFFLGVIIFLIEIFGYSEHKKRIDTTILRDWDKMVDPNDLEDFLVQRLGANHSIFHYQSLWLFEWVSFHDAQRNKLKNRKLKKAQQELLMILENLRQFTLVNFSSVSTTLIRMAPDLKRHLPQYQELTNQLNINVEKALKSNRNLRKLINKKLTEYNDRSIN